MPQLPIDDEERHSLNGFAADARARASSFWDSFSNFALRDNVLEVAVGLIFAASFTAVANSLVTDIILPIISLLPFLSRNLDECFLILRRGSGYESGEIGRYNTVKQAQADGAVVWLYGSFLDKVLRFALIALSLFMIARGYEWVSKDKIVKRQVKCKYCRKYISEKARRCVNCTSWLDGREDK
ncbi:anditomin synthesis protein L [Elsinoe australis]|uniref:Anditomin synthesis protein L n=1 Tax=Elsinoe australis TaxID=40998 RepID=A0A4U7ATI1_9PEZI|nr:anditomin synthesis protein L [Elsinoe australis]